MDGDPPIFPSKPFDLLLRFARLFPVSRLIRAVAGRRLVAVLLFVTFRGRRLSLRTWRGLLCFDWATGNHVINALAEMALFGLWRQLALFGVVVQATAVVASARKTVEEALFNLRSFHFDCTQNNKKNYIKYEWKDHNSPLDDDISPIKNCRFRKSISGHNKLYWWKRMRRIICGQILVAA